MKYKGYNVVADLWRQVLYVRLPNREYKPMAAEHTACTMDEAKVWIDRNLARVYDGDVLVGVIEGSCVMEQAKSYVDQRAAKREEDPRDGIIEAHIREIERLKRECAARADDVKAALADKAKLIEKNNALEVVNQQLERSLNALNQQIEHNDKEIVAQRERIAELSTAGVNKSEPKGGAHIASCDDTAVALAHGETIAYCNSAVQAQRVVREINGRQCRITELEAALREASTVKVHARQEPTIAGHDIHFWYRRSEDTRRAMYALLQNTKL